MIGTLFICSIFRQRRTPYKCISLSRMLFEKESDSGVKIQHDVSEGPL